MMTRIESAAASAVIATSSSVCAMVALNEVGAKTPRLAISWMNRVSIGFFMAGSGTSNASVGAVWMPVTWAEIPTESTAS